MGMLSKPHLHIQNKMPRKHKDPRNDCVKNGGWMIQPEEYNLVHDNDALEDSKRFSI
jgi:hypothetical protein